MTPYLNLIQAPWKEVLFKHIELIEGSSQSSSQSAVIQYGKVPDDADTKWTNVWLRIRPVIRQLTLQAKPVQTPEELCQAAPNPSPLGTLHLSFPIACLGFYRNIRIDITRTDDQGFYETTSSCRERLPIQAPSADKPPSHFCCWLFNAVAVESPRALVLHALF